MIELLYLSNKGVKDYGKYEDQIIKLKNNSMLCKSELSQKITSNLMSVVFQY